jgi:hypothetical protein
MVICLVLGAAVGVMLENVGLGIGIGIAVGIALGLATRVGSK